jgi:integrase
MDMKTMCGAFVDLMSDPVLGDIDGPMVLEYGKRLAKLPAHIGIARRKSGVTTFTELIAVASTMDKMKPDRVKEYLGKLSEFLGWAVGKGFMERNPAAGAMKRKKKERREQDERHPISPENLEKIFSVDWFQAGRGERTAKGLHWSFQPHHYWLPLLGLYVGGRLNELSQLYLDDIRQSSNGQWYIDFNTDQPDKRDLDEVDAIDAGEKRFKTVNAYRVVPLHSHLVRLGLPDYVASLRATGQHLRLFPELRWDETKGYSKQPSRWFNELFMGRKLKIKRDSSQVFHSLRHNFVTALIQLDVPERVVSELAGHERGETMSGKRYAKDRGAEKLAPHIERLTYDLPPITPFDIEDGLVALDHALARKKARE